MYAVSTEDMDALTFGTPRLLRHLMASSSSQLAVAEFDLNKAIEVMVGGQMLCRWCAHTAWGTDSPCRKGGASS